MKTKELVMTCSWIAVFLVIAGVFLFLGFLGTWAHFHYQPTPTPLVLITVKAPTAQIVEMPVEITRIVEIEKIITATPDPIYSLPAPQILSPTPTLLPELACTDSAWVIQQPISDLQASRLKIGTIKRLHFRLENTGTCYWSGYLLTSGGVLPDIPIPETAPGEIADFYSDFTVRRPLEARFTISAPSGSLFAAANSAGPSAEIYYRLDTYTDETSVQSVGGVLYDCGPSG